MERNGKRRLLHVSLLGLALAAPGPAAAEEPPSGPNGFALTNLRVERGEIRAGGPPRDGIPAVRDPRLAEREAAAWLGPGDPVVGVAIGAAAHAYPVHVMERHQLVNDVVGGAPVAATYGPLAGAPRVWDRRVDGNVLEFGVSGLIYNGNFLLYDRESESLWVQLTGEAIAGPLSGKRLRQYRCRQELMRTWAGRHPATRVLALPEPQRIDYRHSPYERYWIQNRIPFPVRAEDARFHAKELVVGVRSGGVARAYLGSLVTAAGGRAQDRLGEHAVVIDYSSQDGIFRWQVPDGVEVTEAYWFAWKAFHPDTEVWKDPGEAPPIPRD